MAYAMGYFLAPFQGFDRSLTVAAPSDAHDCSQSRDRKVRERICPDYCADRSQSFRMAACEGVAAGMGWSV